jgi:hypothetical protein
VLRLTAFLREPLDPNVASMLWTGATGSPPEADDNRPREAIRRQAGPFENGDLEVVVTPGRVDWHMTPRVEPGAEPPPYFATAESAINTLRHHGSQWLRSASPSVNRLALGAILLMPTIDSTSAYEKLGKLLKSVRVDAVHSRDLFYQINWPQPSRALPNHMLNRLTKWSAIVARRQTFQMVGSQTMQPTAMTEDQYCRLECDHNTAAEHSEPFTPEQLDALFGELCDLAAGNTRNGEVTVGV